MSSVKKHYDRDNLIERVEEVLRSAGLGEGKLTTSDLAPLDHFHARGFKATKELAGHLEITPGAKILDMGSGLGGPARYLAETFDCHLQGIDLTPSYVNVSNYLTERVGLSDRVQFDCGDALALPYEDDSFDIVITQHVAMNIHDRDRFYAEAYRVLKSGGQFCLYDVTAGENGDVYFPVPWSTTAETSFLLKPEALRTILSAQGFVVSKWLDHTADGISWFDKLAQTQAEAAQKGVPAIGLNVVIGEVFAERAANLARSLKDGRAGLTEVVARKA